METLQGHFNQWWAVIIFIILYGSVIFFMPYYKKIDRKPKGAYVAFVIAFAVEMHGIPFSMYIISLIIGKNLPEGVLWGHTLKDIIGYGGMYLNIGFTIVGFIIIGYGWYHIYHRYWSLLEADRQLITDGLYRYIRHPQYLGLFLISMGMLLEWATLPLLVLYPSIVFLYYRLAKKEEEDMIEEFGKDYLKYMEKTKMFIPKVF